MYCVFEKVNTHFFLLIRPEQFFPKDNIDIDNMSADVLVIIRQ